MFNSGVSNSVTFASLRWKCGSVQLVVSHVSPVLQELVWAARATGSQFPVFHQPALPLENQSSTITEWAEVIIIAPPLLCVRVLFTVPIRSLAGLIAVGRAKRQLFVPAFH